MKIYKSGKIRDILIITAVLAVTILALMPVRKLGIDGSIKAFMPKGEKANIINDFICL